MIRAMKAPLFFLLLTIVCLPLTSCESPSSGDQGTGPGYTYIETGWHHGWGGPRVLRGAHGLR
jgi:hypothetical protein